MSIDEILKGESGDIEYKEDIPLKSEKYIKTIVAFANCGGGRVVFGIEDDTWKVIGFKKEEVFQKMDAITNAIYDSCDPKISPNVNIQEIEGRYIIIVDIASGMEKPYCIKSQGILEGVYIRVSGSTRKAERYRIKEMILDSGNRSYDQEKINRQLSDVEIDGLCERLYQHALTLAPTESAKSDLKRIGKSQLLSYKLIYDEEGICYATHGYQLLDGKLDDYSEAAIQCAVFKGVVRDIFITRKEFKGSIDEEIDSAYNFVLEHINVGARMDGLARQDIYELPVRTIREIIANAVCHRSYLTPGKIQVALFDDRLEVTSPGMLDYELTLEKIKCGQSKIRNKGIAEVFSYMYIIEGWGSGVPRMYRETMEYGLREPELLDMGSDFRVILYRKQFEVDNHGVVNPIITNIKTDNDDSVTGKKTDNKTGKKTDSKTNDKKLTITEEKIIKIIKKEPSIEQKRIAQMLGISYSGVRYAMNSLKKKGYLSRIGGKKNGVWKIDK